jgi:hypothetical protein
VLTNFVSGGTQDVKAYLDGKLELTSGTNQLSLNNADNPNQLLHFFLDNVAGSAQTEFADGRVALIRLYNGALTSSQVGTIASTPFATPPPPTGNVIPEPGTLALAATGLLPLAGAVVRKRRKA